MHEAFDVKVVGRVCADLRHVLQRKLTGEHDALGAQVAQRRGSEVIGDARLCGNVDFQMGRDLTRHHHDADVGHDHRVHSRTVQLPQVFADSFDFGIRGQNVARHIDARPAFMRIFGGFTQLVEREIARRRPHAEHLSRAIHRVGAEIHRSLERRHVACRRKDFRPATARDDRFGGFARIACGGVHLHAHGFLLIVFMNKKGMGTMHVCAVAQASSGTSVQWH